MQSHQSTGQPGFGIIEVLLVVLVVAGLAVTSLAVYQHSTSTSTKSAATTGEPQTTSQSKRNTNTQPTQITSTTQPAQTTTQYLTIKEWGVRMKLTSDTASLYYYLTSDSYGDYAYLSLKTISDIAPDCAANKTALAVIFRQTPAQRQYAEDNQSDGYIPADTQLGNYWYGFDHSHADCTDGNTAAQAAINKVQPNTTLANVFDTLEAAPYSK
jgi:Tfp pilus assembly protein PilV